MSSFFVKKNIFFTSNQWKLIYEKNITWFNFSLTVQNLIVPKPVKFENNEILFEKIDFLQENRLSDLLHKNKYWDSELFWRIGKSLGNMHRLLGIGPKMMIHGDFVVHNIAVLDKKIAFFDIEPPGVNHDFNFYYFNDNYLDLCSFIFSIFTISSFKNPVNFFRSKKVFVQNFLDGYIDSSEFSVNQKVIEKGVYREFKRWYNERRYGKLEKIIKSAMLLFVVYRDLNYNQND